MKKVRIFAIYLVVAFLYGGISTSLIAQDAQPLDPTPKTPLIPRAPDKAAWTITYRYKQPPNTDPKSSTGSNVKLPDQIVSVQIQKTGKTYHRITTWSSGSQSEAWMVNQRELVKDKTAATYSLLPTEGSATDDYSQSDFEDLTWIIMKYYVGFKKGDHPVFIFQAKNAERPMTRRDKSNFSYIHSQATLGVGSAKPDAKTMLEQAYGDSKATVVLDANTQLPIGYDDGNVIWAYQFITAPADTLVPPPEVVKILQRYTNYVKGMTSHPSAP